MSERQSFCILQANGELMKQYSFLWLWTIVVAMTFSSCELIGDIFKVGVWVGIIIVVVIVALIFWLINKFRR